MNKESTENVSSCCPDCTCGTPAANRKPHVVIGIIVLLIACSIFIYKITRTKHGEVNASAPAFAVGNHQQELPALKDQKPLRSLGKQQTDNTSAREPERNKATDSASATTAAGKTFIGDYLESISSLDKVAIDQDAVFILIPAKKDDVVAPETEREVLAAQRSLKEKGINIGLYTLKSSAPDYSGIAAQVSLPAIVVASKGKGTATVSGEVKEMKLIQAFIASSRAGGCGSGCSTGCGSGGCK